MSQENVERSHASGEAARAAYSESDRRAGFTGWWGHSSRRPVLARDDESRFALLLGASVGSDTVGLTPRARRDLCVRRTDGSKP